MSAVAYLSHAVAFAWGAILMLIVVTALVAAFRKPRKT